MVYHAKGGIWKNTEDEILKAAVMKYGLNQWARISSLLVRKSASQCKSRWYEWLDPAIKKTEWSREEEEKLLHLAKILPNQWRTIAPLVGRTAHQCLEHYEKSLDPAQQKEEDYDPSDDPRRLRPGEIDPNPETKPARPDPIDMDEDEKEMLQEARARLANTKGKKAKRKAREKQLEEAKRIAHLQKRRELKAAGINVSMRRKLKKGEMDYRKEIPFFQEAPAGFFEAEQSYDVARTEFKATNLSTLEGKRKFEEEQKLRQKDAKRQKLRKEQNLPDALQQMNKSNDSNYIRKLNPLQLPNPQMSEIELEELAKLRKQGSEFNDDDDDTVTSSLLSNYKQTPTPLHTPRSTMRTPSRPDTVMMEAQNLIALQTGATPLIGGENTPLHKSDFSSATPSRNIQPTPNAYSTPLRTPKLNNNISSNQTPVRDSLHINQNGNQNIELYEEKFKQNAQSKELDSIFGNLPKPKMKYDFVLPEDVMDIDDNNSSDKMIEDQSEVEEKQRQKEIEEKERQFKQCSSVLQRSLPRCTIIPKEINNVQSPSDMIAKELRTIILHDNSLYPFKPIEKQIPSTIPNFEEFSEDLLNSAKELMKNEVDLILNEQNISSNQLIERFTIAWNNSHSNDKFLFSQKTNQIVSIDSLSKSEQVDSLKLQFELLKSKFKKDKSKADKLEKKINLYTQGYVSKCSSLQKDINQLYIDNEMALIELNTFNSLKDKENYSIQHRKDELTTIVNIQKEREQKLQEEYALLKQKLKEYEQKQ